MKKHANFKMPPLFRKEKDMINIVNNPEKLKKLAEVVAKAHSTSENLKKFDDIIGWFGYVSQLLPNDFKKKEEFVFKLEELVNEYSNE